MTVSEFDLIEKYFKPLSPSGEPAFSLSNDAAIFEPQTGINLVYTMDTLVAGVHFFENDNPELVARKALRVNLSDLAAMASEPKGYLLSLALPSDMSDREGWVAKFAEGLKQDQEHFGLKLWGGDTVSTGGPTTISITAIGESDPTVAAIRSGAQTGDDIYVSGTLGDSAAGLAVINDNLDKKAFSFLVDRYYLPQPRINLAKEVAPHVTSIMDISDGLISDVSHICRQSAVGATIEAKKIPVSEAFGNLLATKAEYSDLCLHGGDDYELLFTANAKSDQFLSDVSGESSVKLTKIGKITDDREVKLLNDEGIEIDTKDKGFRHF